MQAFNKYLKQFPKYTDQVFKDVQPYLSEKIVEKGEHLLEYGKICREIAFIESGIVRLYYMVEGKQITNCFCKENEITSSYTSMITTSPSNISIQALEDTKLIILPFASLQELYDKSMFWSQVGRFVTDNEYIRTECHNRFLQDLSATERYLQILENDGELIHRVPLNYLASYLQVSPETLSRIRKKVAEE